MMRIQMSLITGIKANNTKFKIEPLKVSNAKSNLVFMKFYMRLSDSLSCSFIRNRRPNFVAIRCVRYFVNVL